MKSLIYALISFVFLVFCFFFCFRYWIDTMVMVNAYCRTPYKTTATLVNKAPVGYCHWLVKGERLPNEQWHTCYDNEVGNVIEWDAVDYGCD